MAGRVASRRQLLLRQHYNARADAASFLAAMQIFAMTAYEDISQNKSGLYISNAICYFQ